MAGKTLVSSYIISMDALNVSDLRHMCLRNYSIRFTLLHPESVPDPWLYRILKPMLVSEVDVKSWLDQLKKRVTMGKTTIL